MKQLERGVQCLEERSYKIVDLEDKRIIGKMELWMWMRRFRKICRIDKVED